MSEHPFEDKLEERDDVVDDEADRPRNGEPWTKTSSGDADSITDDDSD